MHEVASEQVTKAKEEFAKERVESDVGNEEVG